MAIPTFAAQNMGGHSAAAAAAPPPPLLPLPPPPHPGAAEPPPTFWSRFATAALLLYIIPSAILLSPALSPAAHPLHSLWGPALVSHGGGAGAAARLVQPRAALLAHPLLQAPAAVEASEVRCEPAAARTGGPTCVFLRLYMRNGDLYFAAPRGVDPASVDFGDAGLALGTDVGQGGWGCNYWRAGTPPWKCSIPKDVRPRVVRIEDVEEWAQGAAPPAFSTRPIVLYSRLNPENVYHRLWDELAPAHAVVCRALALFAVEAGFAPSGSLPPQTALGEELAQRNAGDAMRGGGSASAAAAAAATWAGCTAGVLPPVALVLIDGFHGREADEWLSLMCEELHFEWPPIMPAGAAGAGGVAVLPFVVAGSQGACTHQIHCSNELGAAPLRFFRTHLLHTLGLSSALPAADAPRVAVLVRRAGRRRVTNLDAIAAQLQAWGFETRLVGPFAGWALRDQIAAFANASAVVLAAGAEFGVAWAGAPEGACAVVLFPAGGQDSLAYWAGDKLGLDIAPVVETFASRDDPRIGAIRADAYHADFAVPLDDIKYSAACLNQAPAAPRGSGFGNVMADRGVPFRRRAQGAQAAEEAVVFRRKSENIN